MFEKRSCIFEIHLLRGKARSLLITLSEEPSPTCIIEKLNGVFGNVSDNEAVIENVYQQSERSKTEFVADYGTRLQLLLKENKFQLQHVMKCCFPIFIGLRNKQLQRFICYK